MNAWVMQSDITAYETVFVLKERALKQKVKVLLVNTLWVHWLSPLIVWPRDIQRPQNHSENKNHSWYSKFRTNVIWMYECFLHSLLSQPRPISFQSLQRFLDDWQTEQTSSCLLPPSHRLLSISCHQASQCKTAGSADASWLAAEKK